MIHSFLQYKGKLKKQFSNNYITVWYENSHDGPGRRRGRQNLQVFSGLVAAGDRRRQRSSLPLGPGSKDPHKVQLYYYIHTRTHTYSLIIIGLLFFLQRCFQKHEGAIQCVCFTPDSNWLLTSCTLGVLQLFCCNEIIESCPSREQDLTVYAQVDDAHDLGVVSCDFSSVQEVTSKFTPIALFSHFSSLHSRILIKRIKLQM